MQLTDAIFIRGHWHFCLAPINPAGKFVLANITTIRDGVPYDTACEFSAGDEPFIKHRSYVIYGRALILNNEQLNSEVESYEFLSRSSISKTTLYRTQQGALTSRFCNPRVRGLVQQYLIDLPPNPLSIPSLRIQSGRFAGDVT